MYQMMPMSWTLLYLYFFLIYILINNLNFYSFNYSMKVSFIKKTKISNNWKW
uniref:ATP synthase F0 subunit 8 n=1 Tax=Eucnemidae sp. GENSP01 TaxID=1205624 RepID=A0A0S2MSH5_9COLE|nr:ATP synthase F0 subunit 8 [Eucnemidae sp. GENSP01]